MGGFTTRIEVSTLALFKGVDAAGYEETWIDLFTSAPTTELSQTLELGSGIPTSWGAGRRRIYAESADGSPYWGDVSATPIDGDLTNIRTFIRNQGAIIWETVTLTTSPSTITGFAIYAGETGNVILGSGLFDESFSVSDGGDVVLASNVVELRAT